MRTSLAMQAECMPGEPDALSQSLKANKRKTFLVMKEVLSPYFMPFYTNCANRVRIIYSEESILLNSETYVSTIHPQRAFFYTSVRVLLHPSNSFIDKTILNTWNLESKTDKALDLKSNSLLCAPPGRKLCCPDVFRSFKRQKYSCHWFIKKVWLPFVVSYKIIVL